MAEINWFEFIFNFIDTLVSFGDGIMDVLYYEIPMGFTIDMGFFDIDSTEILNNAGINMPETITMMTMMGGVGIITIITLTLIKLIPLL